MLRFRVRSFFLICPETRFECALSLAEAIYELRLNAEFHANMLTPAVKATSAFKVRIRTRSLAGMATGGPQQN